LPLARKPQIPLAFVSAKTTPTRQATDSLESPALLAFYCRRKQRLAAWRRPPVPEAHRGGEQLPLCLGFSHSKVHLVGQVGASTGHLKTHGERVKSTPECQFRLCES
jgi:hypothetical protein